MPPGAVDKESRLVKGGAPPDPGPIRRIRGIRGIRPPPSSEGPARGLWGPASTTRSSDAPDSPDAPDRSAAGTGAARNEPSLKWNGLGKPRLRAFPEFGGAH
jgi:hypothetical protein